MFVRRLLRFFMLDVKSFQNLDIILHTTGLEQDRSVFLTKHSKSQQFSSKFCMLSGATHITGIEHHNKARELSMHGYTLVF